MRVVLAAGLGRATGDKLKGRAAKDALSFLFTAEWQVTVVIDYRGVVAPEAVTRAATAVRPVTAPCHLREAHVVSKEPELLFQEGMGLVAGKPMLVVYARGGEYPLGSEAEVFDLQKKYIELIFAFIGIKNMRSVVVEPTLQGGPDVAAKKCEEAIDNVREIATSF